MKGVFECLSQKYGGSYTLLSSMAGMIETSAASHTECVLAFGVFPAEIETPLKLTNQVAF
jgi:hypothetical protein